MGTARYKIQVGDEIIEFEGPDGLTTREIENLGDKQLRTAKPGQSFPHSHYVGTEVAHADDESSAGGSWLRGAESGGYFNWNDEIAAAGNAAIPGLAGLERNIFGGDIQGPSLKEFLGMVTSPLDPKQGDEFWNKFGQNYEHNMDVYQQQQQADEALHPRMRRFGEVTGALSTIAPGTAAVRAAVPLAVRTAAAARPIATGIGIGGGTGLVSGAGAGRGNRWQSGASGMLTGMALGGSIAGVAELAPVVANYARIFMNRGSDREALAQMIKALQRDGFDVTSPAGVQQLRTALSEYFGKPVSLADIGAATRARTGVALRAPSAEQQRSIDVIQARQAGQGPRLASDVRSTVAPRTDVHALDEELTLQRAQEAEKLREQALFQDAPARTPSGLFREVSRDANGNIMLEYQRRYGGSRQSS